MNATMVLVLIVVWAISFNTLLGAALYLLIDTFCGTDFLGWASKGPIEAKLPVPYLITFAALMLWPLALAAVAVFLFVTRVKG